MATFVIGDYQYMTLSKPNTVKARAINLTKSSYENIPTSVTYEGVEYSVTSMESCFQSCTALTQAPTIPSSVSSMYGCFRGCTSLTQAPVIPSSVTDMGYCFYNCTSLTTAPTIPNGVTYMHYCFRGCTSLTQAPTIPDSVTRIDNCFFGCTSLTQAPVIPDSVTSVAGFFQDCTSLTQAPVIPSSVTDMGYCFRGCTALTQAPVIPDGVTDINACFSGCTSLTQAPVIPDSVTRIYNCFFGCTSLTQAPVIPDSVTNMSYCFQSCTSLTQAPVIPDGVTNMHSCFRRCTSLTTAPVIPDSVTSVFYCFDGCTSLIQAPVIPSSVTSMGYCFQGCTSLMGDVYVLRNSSDFTYTNVFTDTIKTIYLHAYYNGEALATTSSDGNVSADNVVNPIVLNTQSVESGTYRVDMLLNGHAGSITGMIPNGTLYDMNDNEIEFGVGNNNSINYSRCYAIIQTTNRVPSTNINITIMNVAPSSKYISVSTGVPSTTTPTQIKQEGETNLISPTIDVTNIRFNPETTGINKYTVGDVIGVTTTNMTKSQTNVDNDVKHIVTHASNVRINDTTTLQDWITEQYNNLT